MPRSKGSEGNAVNKAVAALFKAGAKGVSAGQIKQLREKYGDSVADAVVDRFYSVREEVHHQAQKAVKYLRNKYPNRPLHQLLKTSRKWKAKLGLDDTSFEEFRRIFEGELSGQSVAMSRIVNQHGETNLMQKVLGPGQQFQSNGINVKDSEYRELEDILKLNAVGRRLHADVVLQHLTYEGTNNGGLMGLHGKFDELRGDNPDCFIHPVLAALFLPKIQILDEHFLLANISGIVKAIKNMDPVDNKPDWNLHRALVHDPNDVVCDPNSAIRDLKFRATLQHHLLAQVLSLRNGRYFNCASTEFHVAVDNCKLNNFEAPELLYGQDEAMVLSKLLGAFSFRPTVLTQQPTMVIGTNVRPVIPKVYTRHMLTYRNISRTTAKPTARSTNDVLQNVEYRQENGFFIPHKEEVVYSNQVLFVYVPRKLVTYNLAKLVPMTAPIAADALPRNIAGFEKLDSTKIEVEKSLLVGSEAFKLVSAVCAENDPKLKEYIVGNYALVKVNRNDTNGATVGDDCWVAYNPRRVKTGRFVGAKFIRNQALANVSDSQAMELMESRGTIFVYQGPYDATALPQLSAMNLTINTHTNA